MTKKNFCKITCDFCGESLVTADNADFPFASGWNHVTNFSGRSSTNSTSKLQESFKEFREEDKHFCSKECLHNFVRTTITDKQSFAAPTTNRTASEEELSKVYDDFGKSDRVDLNSASNSALKRLANSSVRSYDDEEFVEPRPPRDFPDEKKKGFFRR